MHKASLADNAAQYVRMSTDHQRYSIDNQIDAIRDYADARGFTLVKTYSDPGRSGLRLANRPGLKQLLFDVESGEANYRTVIVYDVSRWGRFQDADEAAYYEHLCRRSGVDIAYCAEPFEGYDSAVLGIVKSLKRFMAAEYSRNLSRKAFLGQARIAALGYRTGGMAGLGYRRLLLDESGRPKQVLQQGERKSIQTDRVVLAFGPRREVALVRDIFAKYLAGFSCRRLANDLNRRGVPSHKGVGWHPGTVGDLLRNPRYVGEATYGRTSKKLGASARTNPSESWIRAPGWRPIIDRDLFERVQNEMSTRNRKWDNAEILDGLRNLLARKGRLTSALINEDPNLPSRFHVATRFGSALLAYAAVGYAVGPGTGRRWHRHNTALRTEVRAVLLRKLQEAGHPAQERSGRIDLYGRTFSVLTVAKDSAGMPDWTRRFSDKPNIADVSVALRLSDDNARAEDIWLLPRRLIRQSFNLAPGSKLWNTAMRYPDAETAGEALARYMAPLADGHQSNGDGEPLRAD